MAMSADLEVAAAKGVLVVVFTALVALILLTGLFLGIMISKPSIPDPGPYPCLTEPCPPEPPTEPGA